MLNRVILLLSLLFVLLIGCRESNRATVTIQVMAENVPPRADVYVIDSPPQFGSRDKGRRALTLKDSLWTTSIPARVGSTFRFRIARGRWPAEAVDSSGIEFPDFKVLVKRDTVISIAVPGWRDQLKRPPLISRTRFENKSWTIDLIENWKFHAGDDTTWAAVDVDDSDWQPILTQLRDRRHRPSRQTPPDRPRPGPRPSWGGIGWFRLRVMVDSSIVHFPLSLHIWQNGASEIYLDGQKLYTFGKVSSIADVEQIYMERNPKPLIFSSAGEHVLAVRYSFHDSERLIDIPTGQGFEMSLGHLEGAITARAEQIRRSSFQQLVFTAIPLCFAIMHFLMFIFSPQNKNNLYFALSMFFFAIMAYTQFGHIFTTTRGAFFWLIALEMFSTVCAIVFSMFSVYSTIYKKLPRLSYIPFIALAFMVIAVLLFEPLRNYFQIVLYLFLSLSIIEMVRLTIRAGKSRKEWSWIISGGFTMTLLVFAYQSLLVFGVLPPIGGQAIVWMYGVPVLAISLSTYISLNISRTNKELQTQLDRVRQLSEEKLQQERKSKEEEIQRRILESDNARKTKELEEARKLQLSMLPKEVPNIPGLDIAVSMKTATEVGGDYYDFHANDGVLTVVIGDATGHGMRAGTMVAAIKSLFSANGRMRRLPETLTAWSNIIRQMNLGNLYMAMSLLRIDNRRLIIANAGMPPALLYRDKEKRMEEIVLKGMPLGGALDFSYDERTVPVGAGDTLLLMSDGFMELFNAKDEMYDERAISAFARIAHRSPQEIINSLERECLLWRGERPQNDDITFIVIKF